MHRRIADDFMVFILRNESRVAVICEAAAMCLRNAFLCGLSGFQISNVRTSRLAGLYRLSLRHPALAHFLSLISIPSCERGAGHPGMPRLVPPTFFFRGTIPPANSPITLTNSVFAGTNYFRVILQRGLNRFKPLEQLRIADKIFSAASCKPTIRRSASPSAARILAAEFLLPL